MPPAFMGFSSFAGGALWWGVPLGVIPLPVLDAPLPLPSIPLPVAWVRLFPPAAGVGEEGVWLRRLAHVSW